MHPPGITTFRARPRNASTFALSISGSSSTSIYPNRQWRPAADIGNITASGSKDLRISVNVPFHSSSTSISYVAHSTDGKILQAFRSSNFLCGCDPSEPLSPIACEKAKQRAMNHACRPSTLPACIGHTAHDVGRPPAWRKGGPTAATAASGLAGGTRRNQSGNLGHPIARREWSLDDAMPWKRKKSRDHTSRYNRLQFISRREGEWV